MNKNPRPSGSALCPPLIQTLVLDFFDGNTENATIWFKTVVRRRFRKNSVTA